MEWICMRNIFFLMLTSLALTGCATKQEPKQELSAYEKELLAEHRRTEEVIAKAALLSSKAVAVYVRTNQALVQPMLSSEQIRQARFQEQHIPNGMEVILSMPFDGAPEPIISRVASTAGYRLEFVNQRPPVSRGVTISSDPRNLRQVLAVIEQQSAGYIEKISIVDSAEEKTIRVFYAKF